MNFTATNVFVPLVAFALSISVLLIVRAVAFRLLHRWAAAREDSKLETIAVNALMTPSLYWCLAIGLYIGVDLSDLPLRYAFYLNKTIYVLVILSITLVTIRVSDRILNSFIQKSHVPIPATGIVNVIVKITLLIMGLLITFTILGISIAPLITALGVVGLAAALAFQDTLANLFAGMYLLVEKTIRIGDFIRLESGQEGFVDDISWRTTRIRMPANNMVVIPNSKLSQNVVVNYSLPEKRTSLAIPVCVSYASDPDMVEGILVDEMQKAVKELAEVLDNPEPVVRFMPGYGETSLEFTISCQVREFTDQARVQPELRKRIFYRLKKEGIEMPFPRKTV